MIAAAARPRANRRSFAEPCLFPTEFHRNRGPVESFCFLFPQRPFATVRAVGEASAGVVLELAGMSRKTKLAAILVAAAFTAEGSMAADRCASPQEVATLKVAALQQELMVAALTCHEIGAYNRFVLDYRPELQRSDRTMLDLFMSHEGSRAGDADYNAFKTRLANLAALRNNDDSGFCQEAHSEFRAAAENRASLEDFVESQPVAVDLPFENCGGGAQVSAVEIHDRVVFHHGVFDSGNDGRDTADRASDETASSNERDDDRAYDSDGGWQ
jgi:hypothetical protein